MQKQTLIHVINSLPWGGAEVLLASTLPMLPEYDHVVVTLCGPHSQLGKILPYIRAHHCLEVSRRKDWIKGVRALRKLIRSEQPVLVHAHLQISGIIAKFACPRKVPLFYTLHNPYSVDAFALNRLAVLLEKITARRYHHLIGVSRYVLDDYRRYVPDSGSGDVLYNCIGGDFFDQSYQAAYRPGSTLRCVSVGNLKLQKNYLYTLQNMLLLKGKNVTLDIYGGGNEEAKLKTFVRANGLEDQVFFKGINSRVVDVLGQYHAYVISSSYEGFGIAPLEAMAYGLPVIASDIPVFKEVLSDPARYFDLKQPDGLANILVEIMEGAVPLPLLSAQSRARAYEIATPSAYHHCLMNIYNKYLPGVK